MSCGCEGKGKLDFTVPRLNKEEIQMYPAKKENRQLVAPRSVQSNPIIVRDRHNIDYYAGNSDPYSGALYNPPRTTVAQDGYRGQRPASPEGSNCHDKVCPDTAPENALQPSREADVDYSLMDAPVPGWVCLPDGLSAVRSDYSSVGNVAQMRASYSTCYSNGLLDVTTAPMGPFDVSGTSSLVVGPVAGFTLPNYAIGFLLRWGVKVQDYQPFSMRIRTEGFRSLFQYPLDRDFEVEHVNVNGNTGGRLFVPFAYRLNPAMLIAQAQPALLFGLPLDPPLIHVQGVPVALQSSWSASVTLLTAHSSVTRDFAYYAGVFGDSRLHRTGDFPYYSGGVASI
jgi:hypothetical protein